jgi:hypothetical protein
MSNWSDYKREETPHAQPGNYRCVILAAEESVSKTSGTPMIIITLQPNGLTAKIKNYIVKNQYFNKNMTSFFDAFPSIGEGNFNLLEWVGAIGAGKFDIDENGYLKLKWFLSPKQAENLPEWQGEKPERQTVSSLSIADDDDLPFN